MDVNTCLTLTKSLQTIALYSHVLPAIVTFFLGLYLLFKTKFSFSSKIFFAFACTFCLWLLGDLVTWVSGNYNFIIFSWSQLDNINIIFFCLAAYFFVVSIRQKDITLGEKLFLFALMLPGFYITFTLKTVVNFDQAYCNVTNSSFLTYYKLFQEFACIAYIMIVGALEFIKDTRNKQNSITRWQIVTITSAFTLFLGVFGVTEYLASEYAGNLYTVSLYGLFILPAFLLVIIFSIVRLRLFNARSIGTQLLVYVMVIMVASQFLFLENSTNRILNGITLALAICFGYLLSQNVRREQKYLAEIESLAKSLETSNEELAGANIRLKELDQQKSEFVSLASHQLRSPLTAIRGYTSLILEGEFGPIPPLAKEPIEKIYSSVHSLVLMVEDFLNVTRIEQGRMKFDFTDFDLAKLVQDVIYEQKPTFDKAGLGISFSMEEGRKYLVSADLVKIKQVVTNFLDNSIKYTPHGSVSVSMKKDAYNKILIAIKDTGVGISATTLPKLFNKFTRAVDANKTNVQGTGLGLYVAKQMVEAHKGRAWAESAGEGMGSTFFVELQGK